MNWFRKHLKHGSRLALFALAVQFALSFGHFHGIAAQAAPVVQAGLSNASLAIAASLATQRLLMTVSVQHALALPGFQR